MAPGPVPLPPLQLSASAGPAVSGGTTGFSFNTGSFSPFGAFGSPTPSITQAPFAHPLVLVGLGLAAAWAFSKWVK